MKRTVIVIVASCASAAAFAGETIFDVRTAYMGGAGVAGQRATAGIQLNPANLAMPGEHDTWGLTLPVLGAGAADPQDLKKSIDTIQNTKIDQINNDISTLQQTGQSNQAALQTPPPVANCGGGSGTQANLAMCDLGKQATRLHFALENINADQVFGNADLGTGLSIPGKKLGLGLDLKATVGVVGKTNISEQDLQTLDDISAVFSKGYVTFADKIQYPQLFDSGSYSPADYNSSSSATLVGLGVGELGLSFAHQYTLDDGRPLALGIKPKLLTLRTFDYTQVFKSNGGFDSSKFRDNETSKQMLNADVGVTLQAAPHWRLAGTVENVIRGKVTTVTGLNIGVAPKITVGAAYNSKFFNWSLDADVNRQSGLGFNTGSQIIASGVEFNAWNVFRLGLGVRHNMMENSLIRDVATAGFSTSLLGLNLGLAAYGRSHEVGAGLQLSLEY